MRQSLIMFTAIVAILSFPLVSPAEEKHGRFFAGAGVNYAVERFDDGDLVDLAGNSSVDNSWGVHVFGGYWWIKHLAVEGTFNAYADFDGQTAANADFDVSIWTAMLDVRVFSPSLWQDRIYPYIRVGGGWMDVELDGNSVNSDDSDFAYNVGLGVDFFVAPQVSLGIDGKHVWGTGDVSDFDHFTFAVRVAYHF